MLELTGITKSYGDQPGVDSIDLVAPAGSRTVIVGASGSGKTTLLRTIAGFEMPETGTIALAGRVLHGPVQSVPPHRRNIAYVAQEGALFPHMSVADNIGFALPRRSEVRQRRIDELLEKVGLANSMRDRRPHELSGGQQQRVALARALAQQPELMLLDEPFASLDTGLREAMRSMVGDVLRDAGITALLVTHDRAEALAFADHLVVMRAGRIADAGPPQRLYQQPADRETAQFLGEAIILSGPISNGQAQTALGPVTVRHGDAGTANVMVRPEQLRVAAEVNGEDIRGRILRRSYRGAHWQLDIACGALEQPIAVTVPADLALEPGAEICLSVIGEGHVQPD